MPHPYDSTTCRIATHPRRLLPPYAETSEEMDNLIRVSAASNHHFLAERIVEALHDDHPLALQAIGVKAVYQAVKAAVTAQENLLHDAKLCLFTELVDVDIDGDVRTAIRFVLQAHRFGAL